MIGKQVTELDALPSFTDTSLLPVHNGTGLKKGLLSQLANYLGKKFSNPNLLINPDFKINQRGKTEYTSNGYTVDRWSAYNVTVNRIQNGGVNLTFKSKGSFTQTLEKNVENVTLSIKVTQITGTVKLVCASKDIDINKPGVYSLSNNVDTSISQISLYNKTETSASMTVEWIKLEQGSIATTFVAPNPANELEKCLRFFQSYDKLTFVPELLSASNVTGNATTWTPIYCVFIQQMRVKPTVAYNSITNRSGAKIEGSHTITLDSKEFTGLRLAQSSSFHTIFANKLTLDAEIY